MKLDVTVPICVTRGLNAREHHFTRAKRVKAEREAVALALKQHPDVATVDSMLWRPLLNPTMGARVTLLRPYARTPLDTDNLSGAFKGVRDEVAGFLGVDDKSERVHWRYVQCKATNDKPPWCKKKRDTHIRIRIEIVPAADVDPMKTAVRVLRDCVTECLVGPECARALEKADALAAFDPQEMYR